MKEFPRTKATAELGVAFVKTVISEAKSIFRKLPEETDLGIDGYIEFVENEIATGVQVGVQIKTGASYLVQRGNSKQFKVGVSKKDLNYWNVQPIPIALIVYDPETKLSGWLDVTGYIRCKPDSLKQQHTTLTIDSTAKTFSIATFQGEFKATFKNYRLEADLFDYADLVASHDPRDKFSGLSGLLQHPKSRFSRLTCSLLLQHLFYHDNGLRAAVSDTLSRYLLHPEVSFVPPQDICNYVVSELKEFGQYEISRLLETAWFDEENLMQRGSLGQSVGVIITNIPWYEQHLCELAIDPSQSYEVRWGAVALAAEFGMNEVIKCIARNFHRVNWENVQEAALWAVEESLRIESAESNLSEIIDNQGYDSDYLVDILRNASIYFLDANKAIIDQILTKTTNSTVRFEADRALNNVMKWHRPYEHDMEKLL